VDDGIGQRIKWMGRILRKGAEKEIKDYQDRFSAASSLYEDVLSRLFVRSHDPGRARETAMDFFNSDKVRFAAIDGTDYSKAIFDLVVFFGGSYAATGSIKFTTYGAEVEYDPSHMKDASGICSCVPLYVSEVAQLDHAVSGDEEEIAYSTMLTDEEIITNSEIANRIMTFSEFFLAYKIAVDPESDVRIILMDRTLAGEISSLMFDTLKRRHWTRSCSMLGYQIGGVPIDENELFYSRHRVHNRELGILPPRGDYLIYSILHHLEEGNKGDLDEICDALGINDAGRKKRTAGRLRRLKGEGMIGDILGNYRIASRYDGYWNRVKALVTEIGESLFGEDGRMTIEVDGKSRYLTTMDIAFITLFTINMLIEECWRRGILLLGITKDTAARDFKRHVLPLLSNKGTFPTAIPQETFEEIPNTDRMFLQAVSMMNFESLPTPWALIEYDTAMRTLVHAPESGAGGVRGAIRNRIIPERLMVKSYIQLAQAENDPRFRSNVLLMDRLVYPGPDGDPGRQMEFENQYGGAREPIRVILERDGESPSPIQNLIMVMLGSMQNSDIPELFGYNKPLFIADKIAKWYNECFQRMVETTSTYIQTNPQVRDFIFYMSSFRERRSTIEFARRKRR